MPAKTWNEMTPEEQAEINAQEDARESYKAALETMSDPDFKGCILIPRVDLLVADQGEASRAVQEASRAVQDFVSKLAPATTRQVVVTVNDFQEPDEADMAEYFARMEAAQYGHRDRFYW